MKAGGYTKNNSILYMGKLMNELGDGAVKLSLCTSIQVCCENLKNIGNILFLSVTQIMHFFACSQMHVTDTVNVKTLNYLANGLLTLSGKIKLQMYSPFV